MRLKTDRIPVADKVSAIGAKRTLQSKFEVYVEFAVALLLARPANARFPSWARMLNTSPFGARRTAVRAEHTPRLLKS